jgi:hypothetical protein
MVLLPPRQMRGKTAGNGAFPWNFCNHDIISGIKNGFTLFDVPCRPIRKNKTVLSFIGPAGNFEYISRLAPVNKIFFRHFCCLSLQNQLMSSAKMYCFVFSATRQRNVYVGRLYRKNRVAVKIIEILRTARKNENERLSTCPLCHFA